MKIKLFEQFEDDPFGEESTYNINDPRNWEEGDTLICIKADNNNRLEIGKEYKIFLVTRPSGLSVVLKGINTYYNSNSFIKKI